MCNRTCLLRLLDEKEDSVGTSQAWICCENRIYDYIGTLK